MPKAEDIHAEGITPAPPPPAPTHTGEGPAAGAAAYVVLHTGVGAVWRQGDVIPAEKLAGHDVKRLIEVGAVRPADEREAAQEKVTLPGTPGAPSLELQLVDRDRRIAEQAQEIVQLRDELRAAKHGPAKGAAHVPAGPDPKLIAEKDKAIADLKRQLEDLHQQGKRK